MSQMTAATRTADKVAVRRALISVSDKTGLVEFAAALSAAGVELVSTGGTAAEISRAGLPVTDVAQVTGFPEIMDGRVKTLHPKIHGGLLAVRDIAEHDEAMRRHGIAAIDLAVINLYPFEETVAADADFDSGIENIDIGGPAMIRAAAKNHAYVTVVVDPADYTSVLAMLEAHDGHSLLAERRRLAGKAFARTAAYDTAIANWMTGYIEEPDSVWRSFAGHRAQVLRYGENPHQTAAFYTDGRNRPGIATARQIQGKQLSYNNLNDTDAAYELVGEFDSRDRAVVAIIKHANPCGVASAASLAQAYRLALRCDPVSAFGGIVAVNQRLDAAAAQEIVKVFTEVVIAPDADAEALEILSAKTNLRLLLAGAVPDRRAGGATVRSVAGGLLVQSRDNAVVDDFDLRTVTKRAPDGRELADLKFAFQVAKHVKSNAIIYVRDGATVGIGAGQMSRVDSARIAAHKARESADAAGLGGSLANGSVVASDAFFPFADGLMAAAEAGATAVIQPGGSMRDDEVIAAADAAGIAMVFTGIRHFRH
jgi:phosphoribosylaminoimidazolecarboxamide formyltransferase/IMP cyclohydrolase